MKEAKRKQTPLLMTPYNVKRILDKKKTQTRRIVKGVALEWLNGRSIPQNFKTPTPWLYICPYGKIGDSLWIRETWADCNSAEGPCLVYRADGAVRTWHEFSTTFGEDYGAGPSMNYEAYPGYYSMWYEDLLNRDIHKEEGYRWKPPIFMPKWACRLWLEITDVRVERVQDISQEDALAEGIQQSEQTGQYLPGGNDYPDWAFRDLWNSINEKNGHGWDVNDWVWVLTFTIIDPLK